jgi:hypothetical protein
VEGLGLPAASAGRLLQGVKHAAQMLQAVEDGGPLGPMDGAITASARWPLGTSARALA